MLLNLSWRDFLNRHPQKRDLNEHANMIQERLSLETDAQSRFKILETYKNLVALSKGQHFDNLQATFLHTTVHGPIQATEPTTYYALVGFHNRATAVKFDPKVLLHRSANISVPSMEDFLQCDNIQAVRDLKLESFTKAKQIPSAAVLPHP